MIFLTSFLEMVKDLDVEIHGICSGAGEQVLYTETGMALKDLAGVQKWFDVHNMAAAPASGSSRCWST